MILESLLSWDKGLNIHIGMGCFVIVFHFKRFPPIKSTLHTEKTSIKIRFPSKATAHRAVSVDTVNRLHSKHKQHFSMCAYVRCYGWRSILLPFLLVCLSVCLLGCLHACLLACYEQYVYLFTDSIFSKRLPLFIMLDDLMRSFGACQLFT